MFFFFMGMTAVTKLTDSGVKLVMPGIFWEEFMGRSGISMTVHDSKYPIANSFEISTFNFA